jgi:predicted phosphodiesterase
MEMDVKFRTTRFVCVSDTHGYTPAEAGFRLPRGDVFIHAGDLTNQGTKAELQKTMRWIQDADYEVKIIVAGGSISRNINYKVLPENSLLWGDGLSLSGDEILV